MFKYANKGLSNEMCTTLHTFPADFQVSVSKLLFDFVDILERGFFTEGILDFCFNDSEIQKSENTVNMFLGIKRYRNQSEWYINKPLSKNLQNIDRNKTVNFGL